MIAWSAPGPAGTELSWSTSVSHGLAWRLWLWPMTFKLLINMVQRRKGRDGRHWRESIGALSAANASLLELEQHWARESVIKTQLRHKIHTIFGKIGVKAATSCRVFPPRGNL